MRTSEIKRKTKETDIYITLNLDGKGERKIDTKVGFFNHMLELFAAHSGFDLNVICNGDIEVDGHHSVEDIGIAMGKCVAVALGDKRGIARYAEKSIPMDEALTSVTLDVSGRSFLVFNVQPLTNGKIGEFDCQLVEEFLRAFAMNAGITLHINFLYGVNFHHIAESIIKGVARALSDAVKIVGTEIPSSKGVL